MSEQDMMSSLWEQVLDEAAAQADENMGAAIPKPDPVQFSKAHEKKMRRLFRLERRKARMKLARRYVPRAAAVIIVLGIISTATLFSVDALRTRFFNFVMDVSPTQTQIQFKEEETHGSYANESVEIGYLPDGFIVDKEILDNQKVYIYFKNNDRTFSFKRIAIQDSSIIDTENAGFKELTINGNKAFLSVKDEVNTLVWHDDRFQYRITVNENMPEDEIIKIGESVKNVT